MISLGSGMQATSANNKVPSPVGLVSFLREEEAGMGTKREEGGGSRPHLDSLLNEG